MTPVDTTSASASSSAGFKPAPSRDASGRGRRPPHAESVGAPFFVSTRKIGSRRIFAGAIAREAIEELLRLRAKYEFLLLAFVFMPDHAHFVIVPAVGFSISQTMRIVKGSIARRMNVVAGLRGPVWQTGFFDRVPPTLDDLNSFIRYTIANPVRAGLVESVSDYPYSSADGSCIADYEAFLELEHG